MSRADGNSEEPELKEVEIYTDGACRGNPGRGGWGAILVYQGKEKELSGGEPLTTNNRMELTAVISALNQLKEPCRVTLTSDSTYVVHAITKGWLDNWMRLGFRKAGNKPLPNDDLWRQLAEAMKPHQIRWEWVRGHEGHPYNERCDALAVAAAEKQEKAQ